MNLSYAQWKAHFDAFVAQPEEDGIDGPALDLILTLRDVHDEDITDGDCLELAQSVLDVWLARRTRTMGVPR